MDKQQTTWKPMFELYDEDGHCRGTFMEYFDRGHRMFADEVVWYEGGRSIDVAEVILRGWSVQPLENAL